MMQRQAVKIKKAVRRGWRWHRSICLLWAAVMFSLAVTGCASAVGLPASAESVLAAMTQAAGEGWPTGTSYSLTSPPESKNALSSTMISALYGPAARRWLTGDAPPVVDAAVFLSTTMHPAELAVFRCADEEAAGAVAAVCRSRIETLRDHWGETPHAAWVNNAAVTVRGDYVLLAVATDPDPLLRVGLNG